MVKQKIISALLMFTFIFSISLISSVVCLTPGYVPVQESTPSEVLIQEETLTDVPEDSTKKLKTFWIFLIIIAFMVLIYLITKMKFFKKKINHNREKKDEDDGSNVSLSGVTKQLQGKNNKDEHMLVSVDTHPVKNNPQENATSSVNGEIPTVEDTSNDNEVKEFIDELELNEVTDKTEEVEEDGQ